MRLFVTFEGMEGSGKTTQIQLLKKALQKRGSHVVITREPGGTFISDQIRRILLDRKNRGMVPLTELFLYEASRAQHVEEVIRPHLKKGKMVISDRYSDATTVYQGIARKLPAAIISTLNRLATQNLKPDLTVVLDCPVAQGLGRLKKRGGSLDRLEREKKRFHERIRLGYLKLARREPRRVKIIDGSREPKDIHQDILALVLKRL